jgi:hypothetical protein
VTTPVGQGRPRRRRRRVPSGLVLSVLFVLVFLLGVALGEALHDNPKPGLTNTIVRTFRP